MHLWAMLIVKALTRCPVGLRTWWPIDKKNCAKLCQSILFEIHRTYFCSSTYWLPSQKSLRKEKMRQHLPCIDETSSANCLPTCMWFTSRFLMLLWSNQSTLTGSILCHTPSVRAKTLVETLLNVSLDLMQIFIFSNMHNQFFQFNEIFWFSIFKTKMRLIRKPLTIIISIFKHYLVFFHHHHQNDTSTEKPGLQEWESCMILLHQSCFI